MGEAAKTEMIRAVWESMWAMLESSVAVERDSPEREQNETPGLNSTRALVLAAALNSQTAGRESC
jgi:hypothetical protein